MEIKKFKRLYATIHTIHMNAPNEMKCFLIIFFFDFLVDPQCVWITHTGRQANIDIHLEKERERGYSLNIFFYFSEWSLRITVFRNI